MFNLSGSEIVFILLLALVVLGPEKLPDAIRRFGKTYGEVKKMSSGFQNELRSALDEPVRELRETANLARKAASFPLDPDEPQKPVGRMVDAVRAGTAAPQDTATTQAEASAADVAPTDIAQGAPAPLDVEEEGTTSG